jgi:uncharacterized protein YdhG (YjbR/CyaY superfamily)
MKKTEDVDAFMDRLEHPLKAEVQELREIIKGVSPDITEQVKWNAPTFNHDDKYIATFNLHNVKRVHLVFHHPDVAAIQSDLLEGDYADGRRMAYFADKDDVRAKQEALENVVRALVS